MDLSHLNLTAKLLLDKLEAARRAQGAGRDDAGDLLTEATSTAKELARLIGQANLLAKLETEAEAMAEQGHAGGDDLLSPLRLPTDSALAPSLVSMLGVVRGEVQKGRASAHRDPGQAEVVLISAEQHLDQLLDLLEPLAAALEQDEEQDEDEVQQ